MVAKHAKQQPLNMFILGDSAIAMLVKGCADFAVLPIGTILAQLPKRQVSSTNHRALVTKLCRENRHTMMSHKLFSNVVHVTSETFTQNSIAWAARASILTMVPSAIASSRSRCGATWRRFSSWRLPRTTRSR